MNIIPDAWWELSYPIDENPEPVVECTDDEAAESAAKHRVSAFKVGMRVVLDGEELHWLPGTWQPK